MLSRRDVVRKLLAGIAGTAAASASLRPAAAATAASAGCAAPERWTDAGHLSNATAQEVVVAETASEPPAVPPWKLLRPLEPGAIAACGWRLAGLGAPDGGACVLTLQNERGRLQRVHICRRQGRPTGLVATRRFDLVVMNGGRGDLPTDEGLAQAVAAVAHVLAENEGRADPALVAALLPHAERVQRFAAASQWTLR